MDVGTARAPAPPVLLRLRSDEQLLALFRAGNEEAFGVIHDRFQQRLLAYVRRMLPPGPRANAEDALQDVFLRAYSALRADDRPVALKAWLYRVAHNRCIDELRRPGPQPTEIVDREGDPRLDPAVAAERRERLHRLVTDLGRLPEQQRSALLMRELEGFTYNELGDALGVSQPAVKSLLVRARMGLAEAAQARDTSCEDIREELASARDRGVRSPARARRHLRDCGECRGFDRALRSTGKDLAALLPGPGLFGLLAGILGGGATAGGGIAGVAGGGAAAATATKVAVAVCCVAVTAGGAASVERTLHAAAPQTRAAPVHQIGGSESADAVPPDVAPALWMAAVEADAGVVSPEPAPTAAPSDAVADAEPAGREPGADQLDVAGDARGTTGGAPVPDELAEDPATATDPAPPAVLTAPENADPATAPDEVPLATSASAAGP